MLYHIDIKDCSPEDIEYKRKLIEDMLRFRPNIEFEYLGEGVDNQ